MKAPARSSSIQKLVIAITIGVLEYDKYSQNTQCDSSSITVHKKRFHSESKLKALGKWHILPLINMAPSDLGTTLVYYTRRIESKVLFFFHRLVDR